MNRPGYSVTEPDTCAGTHCGHLVVTTVSECSPARCADFARRGAKVVILAALPSAAREQQYLDAGAFTFVPMGATQQDLDRVVLAATA